MNVSDIKVGGYIWTNQPVVFRIKVLKIIPLSDANNIYGKTDTGGEVFRWNTHCYVDSYTAYTASIMAVEDEIRRHQLVVKALEAQRDCIDSFDEVSDD